AVVADVPREGDQRQVRAVEHDLEREQNDQRTSPDQHAQGADREQHGGDQQVGGEVRSGHGCASLTSSSCGRVPRMTPPTAATSSTTEVISKARRCWSRKMRPIWAGLPKLSGIAAWSASLPPALSPMGSTISASSAPAAVTAATACQLGPPAHGVSTRPPR